MKQLNLPCYQIDNSPPITGREARMSISDDIWGVSRVARLLRISQGAFGGAAERASWLHGKSEDFGALTAVEHAFRSEACCQEALRSFVRADRKRIGSANG